ncbi:MAG: glycosyltransferase family 4 protein [Treponema sp.]|nr:glycosyltransferase family 4 protein [Treponema sp.]
MKLCIFTNHFFPEDFKVNDIAFELAAKGVEVTVITAIPDYPQGRFFEGYGWFKKSRERVNGCQVIRLPIIPRGKGGGKRLAIQYLSYYVSSSIFTFFHKFFNKYDAVFVHLTSPFFVGLAATHLKKYQKIPMYFWTLDLWPESITAAVGISHPLVIHPLTKQVQKVYDNCDKILIGSKGFQLSILEKGDYKDKLVYFPNWCEITSGAILSADYSEIEPFVSLTEKDFVVLFAGNLGEAQNIRCIIDAAIDLFDSNPEIKFVFLGDGRAKEQAVQKSEQAGILGKTVFFPGRFPIESMPFFMSKASVLLVSLKDELIFNLTVPSKVQFYMAQGKPILAMLNGDGADLIAESHCGIAVPANDKNAFTTALKKMSSLSKDELSQLGANGKEYYEKNFTKEQRMEQLMGMISSSTYSSY